VGAERYLTGTTDSVHPGRGDRLDDQMTVRSGDQERFDIPNAFLDGG
jgi:hypothetical protein